MPKSITLIGAGIMSATLGVFLKKLMPDAHLTIYERLDRIGAESSDAWKDASLSLAALLGASPGASTSVGIMLDVLAKCFPNEIKTDAWQKQLKAMIPSYGKSLIKDGDLLREVRAETTRVLGLETREEEWK